MRLSGFCPTNAIVKELQEKFEPSNGMNFVEYIQICQTLECTGMMYICVYRWDVMKSYLNTVVEEPTIRKILTMFNKNGDGKISIDLLRTILTRVGEPLSEREFEDFLRLTNAKGQNSIDYDVLCDLLASYVH